VSSISEWTGPVVRDRPQGRQQVTVPLATGTALPTSQDAPARDLSAAAPIHPDSLFTSSAALRAGVVSPFLTGHLQP
jgi:hypothetical protein